MTVIAGGVVDQHIDGAPGTLHFCHAGLQPLDVAYIARQEQRVGSQRLCQPLPRFGIEIEKGHAAALSNEGFDKGAANA